ncbi:MAG: fibronectin type III domain-containing protein [Bacteroidales bacterium]|nr:fibronectin type III domain-containing protein [Bacteroidales bacterium]
MKAVLMISNGGLDVVYKYTPAANVTVDIDLCGSAYDTKLYVYENTYTPGAPFACSDDYYTGAPCGQYVSKIIGASLIGGNTYYIVIDGYGATDFGAYSLTISGAIVYPVPPNDLCTGATPVNGPFPQTVTGTTLGATVDCPGVLDWNAVWYAVNLPNAVNDLTVDWCGTADMGTVGVVYYPTCPVVCENYVLYTANTWGICGAIPDATTATTTFLGIPGPTTIYYPAYSIPQMDHVITFTVTAVVCPNPTTLTVSDRTATGAKLGWTAGGTESLWNVEVGLPGFAPGNGEYVLRGSPSLNSFSATPLSAATRYEFYVQADCGTGLSSWIGPLGFSTLITCPGGAITELEVCGDSTNNACNNVLPVNQTSEPLLAGQTVCGTSFFDGSSRDTDWFSFTLDGPKNVTLSGIADFDLQLLLVSSPCPATVIAAGTSLSGVTASVTYQLAAGNYYAWVGPQFTGSFVCGVANNYYATLTVTNISAYCTPAPTSVDGLGITNVTYSTVNNTTGAETGNYGDYSAQIGAAQRTTPLTVYITYETGYTYDTKIWVDWNDDFLFTGTGEEVYTGTSLADDPTTLEATFVIPNWASLGNHRMRIGGVDAGPPTPCYAGSYGSFEDYTLNVTAAPACPAPSTILVSNIYTNQVDLDWTENGTAVLWNVKYGAPGFDPLTEGTQYSNVTKPYTLTGLTSATSYDVYVQAVCGSPWSLPVTFTTACGVYATPFTETVEDGELNPCWTISGGTYNWQIITGASGYMVGSNSFRANFYSISSATPFYLFSPTVDGLSLTAPQLEFDYSYATYVDEVDQLNVYASVNGGLDFVTVIEMPGGISGILNTAGVTSSSFVPTLASQWATITLPLPVGTNMIAFEAISAFGNNLYIDNIKINEAAATKTLNLTGVMLEGLYAGGGTMNQAMDEFGNPVYVSPVADVISVELHDAGDYSILATPAFTDIPLSTSGNATVTGIPSTLSGDYRITIKHRNHIETTTADAVPFNVSVISQNFDDPSEVFGGNLLLMYDMGYAIFGGDITQEGAVDGADVTEFDNDQFNFVVGYVPSDIDGNGSVDSGDGTIIDNNQFNFVGAILPF